MRVFVSVNYFIKLIIKLLKFDQEFNFISIRWNHYHSFCGLWLDTIFMRYKI